MPKPLVVDASLVYRLILPGRHQTEVQSLVDQWLTAGYQMHAPSLWMYELTSALCKTVHFGQLTAEEGLRTLSLAQRLGVRLVAPHDELVCSAFAWTLRLNRATAYDSFYAPHPGQQTGQRWASRHGSPSHQRSWLPSIEA